MIKRNINSNQLTIYLFGRNNTFIGISTLPFVYFLFITIKSLSVGLYSLKHSPQDETQS